MRKFTEELTGGATMKTNTRHTEKEFEQQNQEQKLPYEKPELVELGSVGDMTMTSTARDIGW